MTTWKRGCELVLEKLERQALSLQGFVDNIQIRQPLRVPGTAVFLSKSIKVKDEPWLTGEERLKLLKIGEGFWQVVAHFGYQETPSMKEIFQDCARQGLKGRIPPPSSSPTSISSARTYRVWRAGVKSCSSG
ncbi:hypothetical protein ACEUBB_19980 [Aeromonas rivipollensis]|uniref:KUP/HAK/KT family potassium transporter n=1 Tax=Aeromonas rivipollensis TaxID=948519 RepID=UPI0038D16A91